MGAASRRRILVVDDNPDVAESFARVVESVGHSAQWVTDPRQAVDTAKRFLPDAVFLDIGMPHVNGYELAPMLREALKPRRIRIAAVTAYGSARDRKFSRESGFDAHIVKPLDPELVRSMVTQLLEMDQS